MISAKLDPSSLRAGERVDMGEKRAVTDFALWKFSPSGVNRQMEWDSPWGIGFPGWHIECSAMSLAYLPQPLDIHCGGVDHIRVHHTNEIAQSEAATGKQFARFWVHGEFLVIEKGKMAKSGGNFITLDSLKDAGIPALAYRMFCFTAHYRSPLTFNWEGMHAAAQSLANMRQAVPPRADDKNVANESVGAALDSFFEAVCDDLNMPRALAAIWEILHDENLGVAVKRECIRLADQILGLDLLAVPDHHIQIITDENGNKIKLDADTQLSDIIRDNLVGKIRKRRTARAAKDFTTADRIRNGFAGLGINVKDLPDGTTECQVPSSVSSDPEKIAALIDL